MRNLFVLFVLLNSVISRSQSQDLTSFLNAFNTGDYNTALKYENRLVKEFSTQKDTTYMDIITLIGKANEFVGNKDRALELALENYNASKKITTPKNPRFYRSINVLADQYKLISDYRTARKYYQESYDLILKYGGLPIFEKIQTKSNLAFMYLMTGDAVLAVQFYEENLKFIESNYGKKNQTMFLIYISWQNAMAI